MAKESKNKKKSEELCNCEEDKKKNLDKMEIMNEEDLEKFLKGAKVEEEFNF